MRLTWCSILLLFISLTTYSQNYTRDAGLRMGNGLSLTYRQFTKENTAAELFVNVYKRGFRIGGMKQNFVPALTKYSDQFKLYYGYGVHGGVSYTNQHKMFNRVYKYDWTLAPLFGMDGIVGLEYYFYDVPIMVSAELRPYFEFSTVQYFLLRPLNGSISVKYRF